MDVPKGHPLRQNQEHCYVLALLLVFGMIARLSETGKPEAAVTSRKIGVTTDWHAPKRLVVY